MRSGKLFVFVVLLLVAAACNGGGATPSPVPTPSPTVEEPTPAAQTTAPAETGGLDGFRAFSARIAAAVTVGDAAFFADRALEDEVICSGDEVTGLCYRQPAGTILEGIPGAVAQSDAFTLFSVAEYAEVLQDWFASASPDGAPTLYAIARRPSGRDGEEAYAAIVKGVIVVGPAGSTVLHQQGRIFDFQFIDGRWRFTGELYASLPETIRPWLSDDCGDCYDYWERWAGATR